MQRNFFFNVFLMCLSVGLIFYSSSLFAQEIVLEVGPRENEIQEDVRGKVEKILKHKIPPDQPIFEPLRGKIRAAVRNLLQDQAHMLRDVTLRKVEQIGRAGMMPTGSVTRIYLQPSGGEISPVGQYVCGGTGTVLPGGGSGSSGGGGISIFLGPAGGGAGPNKKHPDAPRVGPRQKGMVNMNNGAGPNGGKNFGRAPDGRGGNGGVGDVPFFEYLSAQDGYQSTPGDLGIEVTKGENVLEKTIKLIAPQLPEPSSDALNAVLQEKFFPFIEISKQAFEREMVQMTTKFAFALNDPSNNSVNNDSEVGSDEQQGAVVNTSRDAKGKQNIENSATQKLSGQYWSLGIEDRVEAINSILMHKVHDTEREQVRALASVSNALFKEMNRLPGVISVEGRSESLWDIKGVQRILYQATEQLMERLEKEMKK